MEKPRGRRSPEIIWKERRSSHPSLPAVPNPHWPATTATCVTFSKTNRKTAQLSPAHFEELLNQYHDLNAVVLCHAALVNCKEAGAYRPQVFRIMKWIYQVSLLMPLSNQFKDELIFVIRSPSVLIPGWPNNLPAYPQYPHSLPYQAVLI